MLDFDDFLLVMGEKSRETDIEIHFKDTFRAFSKDADGKSYFGKGYRRFIERLTRNCYFKMDDKSYEYTIEHCLILLCFEGNIIN